MYCSDVSLAGRQCLQALHFKITLPIEMNNIKHLHAHHPAATCIYSIFAINSLPTQPFTFHMVDFLIYPLAHTDWLVSPQCTTSCTILTPIMALFCNAYTFQEVGSKPAHFGRIYLLRPEILIHQITFTGDQLTHLGLGACRCNSSVVHGWRWQHQALGAGTAIPLPVEACAALSLYRPLTVPSSHCTALRWTSVPQTQPSLRRPCTHSTQKPWHVRPGRACDSACAVPDAVGMLRRMCGA